MSSSERKLPKGGLSEVLRRKSKGEAPVAGGLGLGAAGGNSQGALRRVSFGREEIGTEIKQIFNNNAEGCRNTVFGCSPPVRARNPVVMDSKFTTGKCNPIMNLINEGQGKLDSTVKHGLEQVATALSPPGSNVAVSCESN
uniref:Uncharacterized protein n=1 Tax=Chloropicon laureae TaxID=464258 RepID=A0A7S2Z6V0_9CHLO|mmetsp:Transcript_7414/g.19068  ORF Transcript_7414/g.19068 Transcript_7414/m.19068 type:complete len:141 (+) Transcript_7414:631-1053(+)